MLIRAFPEFLTVAPEIGQSRLTNGPSHEVVLPKCSAFPFPPGCAVPPVLRYRVGGGAHSRARLGPPLKPDVQFSRIRLSGCEGEYPQPCPATIGFARHGQPQKLRQPGFLSQSQRGLSQKELVH